jgi:putative endonuclease
VGYTSNLNRRLKEHNDGLNKSTKPYRPLEIDAYIAVRTENIAKSLEKYFKTGSGIAFSRKRILTYEALAK